MSKESPKRQNLRIIAAISCFCILIIGAVWVLIINQLREDKKQIIEAAVQRNSNLAVALEQYAIRTIDNTDALMLMIKREYELKKDKPGFETFLRHHLAEDGLISLISIADSSGNLVATTEESKGKIINVADREYFQNQKASSKPGLFIGTPVMSRITGNPVIPLARRITTRDKRFGGVVIVGIDPKNFTRFYANANLRAHDIISLVNPSGITYSRRTGKIDSWGEDISKSPLFTHLKTKPVSNYFAPDAIRYIPTYFSYRRVNDYPIIATVGSAEDEILAEFSSWKQRNYMAGGVISLLVILFSVLVAYLLITKRRSLDQLKESEEKYRSFFEKTSDAILIVNSGGKLTAANRAATILFQDSVSSLCDTSFESLVDLSDPAIKTLILNPQTEFKGELRFQKRNGEIFYTETVSSPYYAAGGTGASIMIIRDITSRKEMEVQLQKEQKNYQQRVTREVIQAQEREREEIGRELHDNVNQVLTTVKLYLDLSLVEPEQSPSLIKKSISYVLQSINEIRNLSRDLSAPTLGTKSVIDAITALVEMVQSSSGIRIVFRHHYIGEELSKDQTLAVYRILQEQLNNVIRHSEASRVLITLSREKDQLYFEIKDNGKGFDLSGRRSGIGLNNIVSRARIFDGEVKIISEPGKGCTLKVSMPLQCEKAELPSLSSAPFFDGKE